MNEEKITEVVENVEKTNKGSNIILIVAISCIAIAIIAIVAGVIFLNKDTAGKKDNSSDITNPFATTQNGDKENDDSEKSSSNKNGNTGGNSESSNKTENANSSTDNSKSDKGSSTSKETVNNNSTESEDDTPQANKSKTPEITAADQVANNIFVVTGVCPLDTEYVLVSGDGVTKTEITPVKGKSKSYFFGQVNITPKEYFITFSVQTKQPGKNLSKAATKTAVRDDLKENLMKLHEYAPFFGTKGRIHYYSALLSYSLSDVINPSLKAEGKNNISKVVDAANSVGAEVIYLVAPSSAEIYPETIPSGFSKAKGETVYSAFNSIATSAGAKVIYPADTMKAHKNDGEGFDIYLNTDSHWSAYGAYWALHDLMNHISAEFPAAKPRTLSEMQFYTTELCGGDAFFTYTDRHILETIRGSGVTSITKIKELTTLYSKTMPTNTIISSYKNGVGADIFNKPLASVDLKQTIQNPNGTGLPTAMIVRDSFGVTPFDMFNDRFSTIWWSANGDIAHKDTFFNDLRANKPNYVIYVVSERNLSKLLANNVGMPLTSFAK